MGDFIRGVVVKLHVTPEQEVEFKKNYGCTRKTYNELLNKYKDRHGEDSTEIPTQKELNQFLKETKKELPYLKDTESTSLQQARDDLHKSFKNCHKSKRHNPPVYHSKKKTQPSFRQTVRKDKRPVENNTLTLRKHGEVTFSTSIEYLDLLNHQDTKFNSITVYYDGLNHYASFNIETNPPEHLELTEKYIGCDINSNKNGWLVTSEMQKEFFDVDHENQMIKHINKLMSRCRKGSRRWKKLQKRLLKWYNKRTNRLKDYIEKLTFQLVQEYDTIVFEKNYANIKILIGGEQNMIFPLSRFIQRLKDKFLLYKPEADGVQFVKSHNTSRTCHHCGHINTELKIKTRNWKCIKCGKTLDRDMNAAINILNRWFNGDSLKKH
ncbi:MAG: transposase [Methanobrevibacter sp.]|nr:transposase [Methanobrevibacter sp.]MBE6491071.1 transposase [Methanobrevibacter sp.]